MLPAPSPPAPATAQPAVLSWMLHVGEGRRALRLGVCTQLPCFSVSMSPGVGSTHPADSRLTQACFLGKVESVFPRALSSASLALASPHWLVDRAGSPWRFSVLGLWKDCWMEAGPLLTSGFSSLSLQLPPQDPTAGAWQRPEGLWGPVDLLSKPLLLTLGKTVCLSVHQGLHF